MNRLYMTQRFEHPQGRQYLLAKRRNKTETMNFFTVQFIHAQKFRTLRNKCAPKRGTNTLRHLQSMKYLATVTGMR